MWSCVPFVNAHRRHGFQGSGCVFQCHAGRTGVLLSDCLFYLRAGGVVIAMAWHEQAVPCLTTRCSCCLVDAAESAVTRHAAKIHGKIRRLLEFSLVSRASIHAHGNNIRICSNAPVGHVSNVELYDPCATFRLCASDVWRFENNKACWMNWGQNVGARPASHLWSRWHAVTLHCTFQATQYS